MTFIFKRKSGIYYYRKTYVLPSGRRREIRSSLKTNDPVLAQYLALRLFFNITSDRDAIGVIADSQIGSSIGAITKPLAAQLLLRLAIDLYLAEKAGQAIGPRRSTVEAKSCWKPWGRF